MRMFKTVSANIAWAGLGVAGLSAGACSGDHAAHLSGANGETGSAPASGPSLSMPGPTRHAAPAVRGGLPELTAADRGPIKGRVAGQAARVDASAQNPNPLPTTTGEDVVEPMVALDVTFDPTWTPQQLSPAARYVASSAGIGFAPN